MGLRLCLLLVTSIVLTACGGGSDNGGGGTSTTQGPRNSYPANVQPVSSLTPPGCLPPGSATQAVMQKLNAFWESGVRACACDVNVLPMCSGNGFATPEWPGHIFFDAGFLNYLDASTGSYLPADFFMAHEFGHNIQIKLGLGQNSPGIVRELQADCIGGYYVGFQSRSGGVGIAEVLKAFQFACSIGDPTGTPWWDPRAHGSCADRVAAAQRGYDGYFRGALPGQACP